MPNRYDVAVFSMAAYLMYFTLVRTRKFEFLGGHYHGIDDNNNALAETM